MNGFDAVQQIADALLFEGYVLYPYRASDGKNRVRWQFGVLMPPAYRSVDEHEPSGTQTECILECPADAQLTTEARFLQLQRRSVQARSLMLWVCLASFSARASRVFESEQSWSPAMSRMVEAATS